MADEKRALLQVWDADLDRVVDIEITWDLGYDEDARAKIPTRYRSLWRAASTLVRGDAMKSSEGMVTPYATLSSNAVEASKLGSTATGIFAVAREIFGDIGTGWRIPPPYPEISDPLPAGAVI